MSGLGNIINQRTENDAITKRRDVIRSVLLAHGFTIKEGQTDLKSYVYEAAEALLRELSPAQPPTEPPTAQQIAAACNRRTVAWLARRLARDVAMSKVAVPQAVVACNHRIADARNSVVTSGYVCVDCGALFSAADHGGSSKAVRDGSY